MCELSAIAAGAWTGPSALFTFFVKRVKAAPTQAGPRVVRVGTHALKAGGSPTLWGRLSTHRGQVRSGGGNHRGSIFRLIVGTAVIDRDGHKFPTWGEGSSAAKDIRTAELELECAVSQVIRGMPFLWVAIGDEPGPDSMRGKIERNSIVITRFSLMRSRSDSCKVVVGSGRPGLYAWLQSRESSAKHIAECQDNCIQ